MIGSLVKPDIIADKLVRFPSVLYKGIELIECATTTRSEWRPVQWLGPNNPVRYDAEVLIEDTNNPGYGEYSVWGSFCISLYIELFGLVINPLQLMQYKEGQLDNRLHLTRQEEGAYIGPNVDEDIIGVSGLYTVMFFHNNDYDGGELVFPELDYKVRPGMGDIYIFPSEYPYESDPIKSGVRFLSSFKFKAES